MYKTRPQILHLEGEFILCFMWDSSADWNLMTNPTYSWHRTTPWNCMGGEVIVTVAADDLTWPLKVVMAASALFPQHLTVPLLSYIIYLWNFHLADLLRQTVSLHVKYVDIFANIACACVCMLVPEENEGGGEGNQIKGIGSTTWKNCRLKNMFLGQSESQCDVL